MLEHEEVYLGAYRNKDNYSYVVYYGPQDSRNVSQCCNPIVTDNDGAELEALVHYLENLSAQPKRDRTHPYIVKTSSVNILTWILIYIPAFKTYGWVHPKTGGPVTYEPILRCLDALLLYIRFDGTAIIFAFVPPRAVLPVQIAKTASEIVLRDWEALCYSACVQIVHAVTRPGYSASPEQIKEAFDAMTNAQKRMSVEEGGQRAGKKSNLGPSATHKGSGELQQAPGLSTALQMNPSQRPKAAVASESGTHRMNIPVAPRSLDAPIMSSEKWMELIKSGEGRLGSSAKVFAELCEDVVPNFAQSKVKWPWITADMRSGIEERMTVLQESWEHLHAPSTGQKRSHPGSGSPAKKQKTSARSRQTDSIHLSEPSKFRDEVTFTVTNITRRLRNQILGQAEPLSFIVVFRNDYEDVKKYTAIDHLPHLIAAANQVSKKKVKLVTFPKSFVKRFSEMFDRRGLFGQCDFALEKKTYAHDEELVELLKTVPTLKLDSEA